MVVGEGLAGVAGVDLGIVARPCEGCKLTLVV